MYLLVLMSKYKEDSGKKVYSFKGRDFISPNNLSKAELEFLVETGTRVKHEWKNPSLIEERKSRLFGKRAKFIFIEPSTRTRSSSKTASELQGASVDDMGGEETNSFVKGEPWRDAFEGQGRGHGFDYWVLRTRVEGAPLYAAQVLKQLCLSRGVPYTPVINAGDGRHWHPTQGSLDHQFAFSIFCPDGNWGGLEKRTVCYAGDLANSRTVHTNMLNWVKYPDVKFVFVSIDAMRMPQDYLSMLDRARIKYKEVDCFDKRLVSSLDKIYLARPQKERWDKGLTLAQKTQYSEAVTLLHEYFPQKHRRSPCQRYLLPVIFHALPRDKSFVELEESLIDSLFWGAFDQMEEGIYNRAGLFNLLLGVPGFGDDLPERPMLLDVDGKIRFESEQGEQKAREGFQVGPITNGYVLDHISDDYALINHIQRMIPQPRGRMFTGRVLSKRRSNERRPGYKWIMKIEDSSLENIEDDHLPAMATSALRKEIAEQIALVDPELTINIIKNGVVKYKVRAAIPDVVEGRIQCLNEACVSSPVQQERVRSVFRIEDRRARVYRCDYCDTLVDAKSIRYV